MCEEYYRDGHVSKLYVTTIKLITSFDPRNCDMSEAVRQCEFEAGLMKHETACVRFEEVADEVGDFFDEPDDEAYYGKSYAEWEAEQKAEQEEFRKRHQDN